MRSHHYLPPQILFSLMATLTSAAFAHDLRDADTPEAAKVNITQYPYNTDETGNDLPVEIGRFNVTAVRGSDEVQGAVEVSFVRYPNQQETDKPPIIFLSETTSPGSARQSFYAELASVADVVILHPRGFGLSAPLPACKDRLAVSSEEINNRSKFSALTREYAESCRNFLEDSGISLRAYTREQRAADIHELVHALDVERIVLIAEGFQNLPALQAVKASTEHIASMVMINPPAAEISYENVALRLLHDDAANFRAVRADLRTQQQTARITTRSGATISVTIGEYDLVFAVISSLSGAEQDRDRLREALRTATRSDYALLSQLVLDTRAKMSLPDSADLLHALDAHATSRPNAESPFDYAQAWPAATTRKGISIDRLQKLNSERDQLMIINTRLGLHSNSALSARWDDWSDFATVVESDDADIDSLTENEKFRRILLRFVTGQAVAGYSFIDSAD